MNKILCLLAFCAVGFAFAGTPLGLKQALSEGLKGNLDIQKSELGSDGIDAKIDAAFRKYFPQLTASGTVTRLWMDPTKVPNYPAWIKTLATVGTPVAAPLNPNDAFMEVPINWNVSGDLTLKQFLYVPQVLTGIAMAKKGKEIDALVKQEIREGIIFGISMQYWSIVYMEENLEIMQKSKDNLGKTREAIAAMVEHGIVKKGDLNTMDINLVALGTQIDNLKVQIQTQKDNLLQIMGRPIGEDISLTDRLSVDLRAAGGESGDPLQSSIAIKRMDQMVRLQECKLI